MGIDGDEEWVWSVLRSENVHKLYTVGMAPAPLNSEDELYSERRTT